MFNVHLTFFLSANHTDCSMFSARCSVKYTIPFTRLFTTVKTINIQQWRFRFLNRIDSHEFMCNSPSKTYNNRLSLSNVHCLINEWNSNPNSFTRWYVIWLHIKCIAISFNSCYNIRTIFFYAEIKIKLCGHFDCVWNGPTMNSLFSL